MKRVICFCVIIAVFSLAAGNIFAQSGVKETRNVSDFTGVNFGVAGNLHIKLGSPFQVVLEGESRYLKDVETVVKNGKLIIRIDNHIFFNNEKVDVFITMPEIKSLGLSGSGRAAIEGTVKADMLDLSVSGSGKISIPGVILREMICSISGSGDIVLEGGEAEKADLSISGSGSYSGENTVIKNLEARISGSGNCSCNVSETLEASISGSGNIIYSGNPRMNVHSSGSGHVRSR